MAIEVTQWPHKVETPFDPNEVKDYKIDWSDVLADGESVADSSWTAVGANIESQSFTSTSATVFISYSEGTTITITNHIVTDNTPAAREYDRTLIIKVKSQ